MFGGYGRGWRHRRLYYMTGIPGLGRGRCFWYPPDYYSPEEAPARWPGAFWEVPPITEDEELRMLEEDEQALKEEIERIASRIKEIRTAGKGKK